MFSIKSICTVLVFVSFSLANAQEVNPLSRKKITISKIQKAPKIDGVLNDPAWQAAAVATNFIERLPHNGRPIPDSLETTVKIVYDDLGIYFGATMKDPEPEKILKELTERDKVGNDDFFFVLLNGYNDRQQSLEFVVTAAGVQYDAKMTNGNEDDNWDGIWYSAVQINQDNWVAEFFIPYSELRFPNKNVQVWGLQMERAFKRAETRYSWSHIDNEKSGFSIYDGEIYGIKNIEPPVRLSFRPYFSTYLNNYDEKTEILFNGGMDLKYGINEAFTLDMILIPDFGQSAFDDTVLNLSAFETQYEENRGFFTEGTELFTKGDLFYSRRIGGVPNGGVVLGENEEIGDYPRTVKLINALKISGRTDKGLGIGFFNAVTKNTYAQVNDTVTQISRKALVAPLTNYNIFVLDQRFGDRSSISLVNTNVLREAAFRDANVTGVYTDITNKKNTMNYWAGLEGSWVVEEKTKFGVEGNIGLAETKGKHRFEASAEFRTKEYDINDMGYSSNTNFIHYYTYYGYRYLKPKGGLNNLFLNFNFNYKRRLEPDLYNNFLFNFNSSFTTEEYFGFGGGFETTAFGTNDIYEPRVEGRHVKEPAYYDPWIWISTDYRKKLAMDATLDWYIYDEKGRGEMIFELEPQYRFSDKWKIWLTSTLRLSRNDKGFVDLMDNAIIFGERDRNTFVNSLESHYIFNNKISLNLAFRHYWSEVEYEGFFTLETDGSLMEAPMYDAVHNTTYNTWNVDLRFSWWFAPGSQLTLLYRNSMESRASAARLDFSENFDRLFAEPQFNSISLRVTYYLDYNRAKDWLAPQKSNRISSGYQQKRKRGRGFSGDSEG